MKRAQWLNKKLHSVETIAVATGGFVCFIQDADDRRAEGFGRTEELAFSSAHAAYRADRHRAALTSARNGVVK